MSSLPNNRLNCGTIYDILSVKGAFHQIHTQSSVIFSLLKQKQEWPWQSDQGYLSLGLRLNIINKNLRYQLEVLDLRKVGCYGLFESCEIQLKLHPRWRIKVKKIFPL